LKWYRNFIERGCICDQRKGTFRPTVGLGAAVNSVTPDMLQRVWSELDYGIGVCRVTKWGHIECA
jgi:hypothetical protein